MIAIFTPTYNRRDSLMNLFKSLCNQTDKNFIWYIVDDGSTDETSDEIKCFKGKSNINIIYIYQNNAGKHIAYNHFLDAISQENIWHVCVDSDDILSSSAVKSFNDAIESVEGKKEYIGIVYPKSIGNKNSWIDSRIKKVNIPDFKFKYGKNIETVILFSPIFGSNLRFPVFANETFLSEEILYVDLVAFGSFLPINNRYLYFSDYRNDGLTKNIFNNWKKNPKATRLLFRKRYEYICDNLLGLKKYMWIYLNNLNYDAFYIYEHKNKRIKLSIFLNPFAWLIYFIRFSK